MRVVDDQYTLMQREACKLKETKDCAVKAFAVATGMEYKDAHTALKKAGRKNRRGTPNYITRKALKEHGFKTEEYKHKAKTVRTLARELRHVKGTFLVWVRGHILCIKDGRVVDWTLNRLHRIECVERVVKKDPEPLRIAASDPPKVDIRKVFENHRKHWSKNV